MKTKLNPAVLTSSLFLLTFSLLTGCDPEEKGRVVAAKGYDVPSAWDPIPIRGRTFYSMMNDHMDNLRAAHPDYALFDNPWREISIVCPINDLLGDDSYFPPEKAWKKSPIRISELYAVDKRAQRQLSTFEKDFPNNPFTVVLRGGRPIYRLKGKYDTDTADFNQWRKDHPGFFSFCAFDEYDSDSRSIVWKWKKDFKHPEIKERYRTEYGLDRLEYGFPRKWMEHDFEKTKAYHFGTSDLYGLWSGEISMAHSIARNGLNFLWYEAEHGSVASPWRWGSAYSRGAAHQFQIPFGWYTAMFTFNSLTRDGKNPETVNKDIKMWRDSFTYWPNPNNRKTIPHLGASRSLLRRNVRYGYFIGTLLSVVECGEKSLYQAGPDGKSWELSPYGQDYEDLMRWHRNHDRGTVYTPVALLASMDEAIFRQGFNVFPAKDEGTIISFFHTLVPTAVPSSALYCDPKKGLEGCLWNSEFGEILDVICPDCGQKRDVLEDVLGNYKAAFLVGYHDPKTCDVKAIADYIEDGGTVFCSYDQIEAGLVSSEQAGVAFGDKTVLAGKKLLNEDGIAVEEIADAYTLHVPSVTNAVPFLKDENGAVVAWAAKAGDGRVITVTARRMMPDVYQKLSEDGWRTHQWFNSDIYKSVYTGQRTFPIVHYLLKRVQDDVMPIRVTGDIQWGLNYVEGGKVEKIAQKGEATARRFDEKGNGKDNEGNTLAAPHWLLWLINNNGVTKFALEPEDIDLTKTSTVTVDLKDLKGAKVYDITAIDKTVPIDVKDGKFSVRVKPGEDVRISIVP